MPVRLPLAARNYQKETMKDTRYIQHLETPLRPPPGKSSDLRSDQKPADWIRQILKEARSQCDAQAPTKKADKP